MDGKYFEPLDFLLMIVYNTKSKITLKLFEVLRVFAVAVAICLPAILQSAPLNVLATGQTKANN